MILQSHGFPFFPRLPCHFHYYLKKKPPLYCFKPVRLETLYHTTHDHDPQATSSRLQSSSSHLRHRPLHKYHPALSLAFLFSVGKDRVLVFPSLICRNPLMYPAAPRYSMAPHQESPSSYATLVLLSAPASSLFVCLAS